MVGFGVGLGVGFIVGVGVGCGVGLGVVGAHTKVPSPSSLSPVVAY